MSEELEESVNDSDENLNDDTGETTETPDKVSKNKSNFKKLSEALKEERRLRAEMEEELNAWRSENPELVKESLTKKETKWVDKSELALFIATNPDAREHLSEIKEFAEEFGIKLDSEEALAKAWKRVKPAIPVESKTERDFDIKSKWSTKKVDLSQVTMDEIYEEGAYTKEQRSEWRKIHKMNWD